MLLATLVATAFGCAGLVHEEGEFAESGSSEAIFEVLDGEIEVTYEVVYEGDAASFGWIVPVPGEVLAVEDGDEELLAALREDSEPTVLIETPAPAEEEGSSGGCFGRAGSAKSDGSNEALAGGDRGDVTVVAEGFTGSYDYVVVSASDAGAFEAWATEGGWSIGSVTADVQHYLDLGHPLVLLDLAADGPTEAPTGLPPIRIRYAGSEMRFPSQMAQSSGQQQRTTVYTLGAERAELADGWSHEDVDWVEGSGEPADVYWDALAELGAERTWARTYAGDFSGRRLTRFDLVAEAAVHDRDAVFQLDGTQGDQDLTISVWEGNEAWALLPLGLLLVAAGRRRRGHVSPRGANQSDTI